MSYALGLDTSCVELGELGFELGHPRAKLGHFAGQLVTVGERLLGGGEAVEKQLPFCCDRFELDQTTKLHRVRQHSDFRQIVEWRIARERDRVGLRPRLTS